MNQEKFLNWALHFNQWKTTKHVKLSNAIRKPKAISDIMKLNKHRIVELLKYRITNNSLYVYSLQDMYNFLIGDAKSCTDKVF